MKNGDFVLIQTELNNQKMIVLLNSLKNWIKGTTTSLKTFC